VSLTATDAAQAATTHDMHAKDVSKTASKNAMHDKADIMCNTAITTAVDKEYLPIKLAAENHSSRTNLECQSARLQTIKGNLPQQQMFYTRQILNESGNQYLPCIDDSLTINKVPRYSLSLHAIKGNQINRARQAVPQSGSQCLPCSSSTLLMSNSSRTSRDYTTSKERIKESIVN
jgi:predicted Abi (CAAX) family protease